VRRIWLDGSGVSSVYAAAERLKREERNMDLYQGLVLGFLALGVLVLMGIFTRLGPLSRSLETSDGQPTAEPRAQEVGTGATVTQSGNQPEAEAAASGPEPGPAGGWELAPIAYEEPGAEPGTDNEPAPEPVATEESKPVASEEREPEPEPVAAAQPEPEPVAAAQPEPEPVAAAQPEPEPFVAEEPESEQVASEDSEPEPEEKPFQRDGRWWFRRDDELLVYDEASGEWLPGDAGASPFLITTDHAPAAADATSPGLSQGTASVATREREDVPEEGVGRFAEGEVTEQVSAPSFWKCATCGAVNGSTGTTCRMCFAARP
jgi:hypothetical protein